MAEGTCSVSDCDHPAFSRTWCRTHYNRWNRHGDVQADKPVNLRSHTATAGELCSVPECGRPAYRRSWCRPHHQRWLDDGDVKPNVPIRAKAGPMGTVACSIDGCRNPSRTRTWCHAHYKRFRETGSPQADVPLPEVWESDEARFWSKVNQDGPVSAYRPELGPCFLWKPEVNSSGYGVINLGGQRVGAHHAGWIFGGGAPIPDGLELDHLCRVRRCVRKTHLEPVTRRVNVHRSMAVSAFNLRKTHCKRGHPFDEANTYRGRNGRRCRACRRRGGKVAAEA